MDNIFEEFQRKQREDSLKWLEEKEKKDAKSNDPKHSKTYQAPYIRKFGDTFDYFA